MANGRNFLLVSPGIFTSEVDLSLVARQVGVTTLGLAGETTKGPAFQPVFVNNYDEFKLLFGGLNSEKFKETGFPKYELPYIAKSYLTQSGQLFVTRVLGFSGYDAGEAWGITLDAAIDPSTSGTTTEGTSHATFITYTVTSAGTLTGVVIADSFIQDSFDDGDFDLDFLITAGAGDSSSVSPVFVKGSSTSFTGFSFTFEVTSTDGTTGATSGVTTYYSGTSFSDIEDKLVALVRSRGTYGEDEVIDFQVTGSSINIDASVDAAEKNPLETFELTGTSTTQGAFSYEVSFDKKKKNYISRVLGRTAQDGKTAVFVEELYQNMLDNAISEKKIRGINLSLIEYGNDFDDNLSEFSPAVTPFIVSEVRGTKVSRLFRLWTISDGDSANSEIKISIQNIKPDEDEFDVIVRSFSDTDSKPLILERFSRCTMDKSSNNYIARRIGTLDGEFELKSKFIMVELSDNDDISDAVPAGFEGFTQRDYAPAQNPMITYKKEYNEFEKKRKVYLGLSDAVGIDQDFFDFKGKPSTPGLTSWTATTKGFHLDSSAASIDVDDLGKKDFEVGCCVFGSEADLEGTDYETLVARKFTLAPYGGFDGWDVYRDRRTNTDKYLINGTKGDLGLTVGTFKNKALSNGELGITSDFYAYLEAIRGFANPEAVNINVLATPGIDTFDNSNLIEETIEMAETERADSLYVVTTPDTNTAGEILTAEEVVDFMTDMYDSNYTATYWPWVQISDTENNVLVFVPPTRDVVRNIALTDNIAFPWFATAGINRGKVDAIKARVKLTLEERDTLYEGRINPIATFSDTGPVIFGNKTLQVKESALDRVNVRRLLLQARKLISAVAVRLLFEQNDDVVRNQFLSLVNPILDNIRSERGISDFRVVVDNDPEARDRNELNGRILLKPISSLEFITIEFVVTNSGAQFENI